MNDYARRRLMSDRRRDYADMREDYAETRDYRRGYEDGRRDYIEMRGDYNDYRRDYEDGHGSMKLTRHDYMSWKKELKNADGSHGAHYEMGAIMSAADKVGVKFKGYDEADLCMAVNMLYSDFCEVIRKFISPDKELMFFIYLAKAWLEDEDAPEGSEKLALYKYCIVDV